MKPVRKHEKPSVIFRRITIAEGRTETPAKPRNPLSFSETSCNQSQAVCWKVGEAANQLWADDGQ